MPGNRIVGVVGRLIGCGTLTRRQHRHHLALREAFHLSACTYLIIWQLGMALHTHCVLKYASCVLRFLASQQLMSTIAQVDAAKSPRLYCLRPLLTYHHFRAYCGLMCLATQVACLALARASNETR